MKMKVFAVIFFTFSLLTWNTVCGGSKIGSRIVGGTVANAGQFPFMVAINVETSNSRFFCGGALISNQWILTSGYCVYGAVSLTLRLGSNSIMNEDPNRVTVATSEVLPHPDFNPETLQNDIGLVKLRLPIEFTDYIKPINVAGHDLFDTESPTAVGWGQTSDKIPDLSSELNYVALAIVSNAECRFTYGNQITDNMVCVEGNYNEGTCLGDSGSPLVIYHSLGMFVEHVGVSSFHSAKGCESFEPSGFTRSYPYIDWIRNVSGIV